VVVEESEYISLRSDGRAGRASMEDKVDGRQRGRAGGQLCHQTVVVEV